MPDKAPGTSSDLVATGAGQYSVNGELSFATAAGLLDKSTSVFAQSQNLAVDLSGVTYADSAGLALLIEWLRLAKQRGAMLRYSGLPGQLKSLAAISEVESLLENGAG